MTDREAICRRLHALETYAAELQRLAVTVPRESCQGPARIRSRVEARVRWFKHRYTPHA